MSVPDALWLHNSVRYGSAFLVLVVLYASAVRLAARHSPTAAHRAARRPGGRPLWVAAAATLSYTLRTAGKLALIYGSFAGLVATLVFLYISATTLIFGAEINAVLASDGPAAA